MIPEMRESYDSPLEPLVTADPQCDFCGVRPPPGAATWYPCATFTRVTIRRGRQILIVVCECHEELPESRPGDELTRYVSLSAWVACPACRALIDADDRDGLAARTVSAHSEARTSAIRAALLSAVFTAHEGFFRHRLPLN
jgi:hypothetical protein